MQALGDIGFAGAFARTGCDDRFQAMKNSARGKRRAISSVDVADVRCARFQSAQFDNDFGSGRATAAFGGQFRPALHHILAIVLMGEWTGAKKGQRGGLLGKSRARGNGQ